MEYRIFLFPSGASKIDIIGNNGYIAILDDVCLEDRITLSADSNHILELTIDSKNGIDIINKLAEKQIIKIKSQEKFRYFTIIDIGNDLDEVVVLCRDWTIEAQRSMYILDSKPRDLDSLSMMDHLKNQTEEYKMDKNYARDLEVGGNIADKISTNIWHDNFYNATNDLMELYGAECKREGFKVELVDYVGSKDIRYKVEYGINLEENISSSNFDFTIGVLAKGYDKLYADNIIYSGKLTENPNLMGETQEIEYPIRVREEGKEDEEGYTYFDTEEEAKAELERLASEEFTVNHVDQPLIEHTTKFLDLSLTEEYKDEVKTYLGIGDKVNTIIPQFNLNIETRVVEMVIVNDVIEDITLSNNDIKDLKPPTLNSIKQEITKLPSVEDVIITAKNESFSTVMSGFGGHARHYPDRSIYMDTDDEKTCQYCFILNYAGWFFSKGGVNPRPEDVTMVADINGNFYADIINTGTLNADLIKAGILKSLNDKTWINMEDGSFNFADALKLVDGKLVFSHTNGSEGITIDKGGFKVTTYSSTNGMEEVAKLIATSFAKDRNQNGLSICTTGYGDYVQIGYERENGAIRAAMFFVPVGVPSTAGLPYTDAGIYIKDKTFVENLINFKYGLYLKSNGTKDHVIYNDSSNNYLNIFGDNGINLGFFNGDTPTNRLILHEAPPSGTGDLIESYGNWNFKGYTLHNLTLANYKLANTYANLETKSIAEVSALETNSTDNVRYVYKDITSKDNRIVLNIPSEYQGRDYDVVGVAKLGFGDYRISSKEENRFIIETDREMTMNIEISIN